MDCQHVCAFPKRELDGITVEELLCPAGRSVAANTDAAETPRFIGFLVDAACKFVPEARSTEFFTTGDVNGS